MFGLRGATKGFCATLRDISDEHSRLVEENESLRTENANLKRLLRDALEKKFSDEDKLQSENDGLRKLVRDMWREGAFEPGAYCAKAADELEERTRELGVEVG